MEFEFTPASFSVLTTLSLIALLLVALASLFVWLAWSAPQLSLQITNDALRLRAPMYGRTIPRSHLQLEKAEIVHLDAVSPLRPALRTNGIGLPGYGVGWFKLKNAERALVALTSRERVLYVPTSDGYSLLMSVREPERVLEQLRGAERE